MPKATTLKKRARIFAQDGMLESTEETNPFEVDLDGLRARHPEMSFVVFDVLIADEWREVATVYLEGMEIDY